GGVGTGLYGILVLAIIAVFLAGLMVGRTPEYLGKKLGRVEITAAAVAILAMPTLVLLGAGLAIALPGTTSAMNNDGSHGFSEVLSAYASAANNNGSAFAGITVTSDFFQSTLGVCMLLGRFVPILAVLALAGSLAHQRRRAAVASLAGKAPPRRRRCGHPADQRPAVRRPRRRHGHPRCRPHLLPGSGSGPARGGALMTTTLERPQAQAVEAGAFAPRQLWASLPDALRKLDPRAQLRTPVMFVVWVGSVLVTISAIAAPSVFAVLIAVW